MLKDAYVGCSVGPHVRVVFDVQLSADQMDRLGRPPLGLLHPDQTFLSTQGQLGMWHYHAWEVKVQAAFMQIQLANMISLISERVNLPTCITLTTNADRSIPGVEIVREDSRNASYCVRTKRKKGRIMLQGAVCRPDPICIACPYDEEPL